MGNKPYPSALAWVDIESTGLPEGNDFSKVEILEIAVIVTDYDLKPHFGYVGVVGRNEDIDNALRSADPVVIEMHKTSGLLKDVRDGSDTLVQHEAEICGMFKTKTTQNKGEFVLAGSGVSHFDFPLIKAKMPEFASWLTYYCLDIGNTRRSAYILSGGRDVIPPVRESFQEGVKKHRALDDIKAHLKEAEAFREFYRRVTED